MKIRLLFCLSTLLPTAILAADFAGSSDHPQVKRITGSEIFFSKTSDFTEFKLALGKIEWSRKESKVLPFQSATVEGKLFTNYYKIPEKIGILETHRNYEQDLKEAGFEILFSGQGEQVETVGFNNQIASEILSMAGASGTPEEKAHFLFRYSSEKTNSYISAKKSTPEGDLYTSIYIVNNTKHNGFQIPIDSTLVRMDVCEVKPREQRMELVPSSEMANQIALNGRIALYGILFDSDKAAIRPDSEPTLDEIARLLREKPELRILVVGHTDASGSFDYNRTLSQKRAESVIENLTAKGISKQRLFPVGVAFASPVAANTSEDGKAKNRRVELVDMADAKGE